MEKKTLECFFGTKKKLAGFFFSSKCDAEYQKFSFSKKCPPELIEEKIHLNGSKRIKKTQDKNIVVDQNPKRSINWSRIRHRPPLFTRDAPKMLRRDHGTFLDLEKCLLLSLAAVRFVLYCPGTNGTNCFGSLKNVEHRGHK